MTQQETTLLKRNFKMNLAVILTIISCTATFVYQGSVFVSKITQAQAVNTINIANNHGDVEQLKSTTLDHEIRLTKLESSK